jgi:hypothetical protein
MNASAIPQGPGSVAGAPHLPEGFTGTFTSRYVDTGGLRQHVVTGGGGPPLRRALGPHPRGCPLRAALPAATIGFRCRQHVRELPVPERAGWPAQRRGGRLRPGGTSRPRCAGCSATSAASAATPATSPCPASRPAACPRGRNSSRLPLAGCSRVVACRVPMWCDMAPPNP